MPTPVSPEDTTHSGPVLVTSYSPLRALKWHTSLLTVSAVRGPEQLSPVVTARRLQSGAVRRSATSWSRGSDGLDGLRPHHPSAVSQGPQASHVDFWYGCLSVLTTCLLVVPRVSDLRKTRSQVLLVTWPQGYHCHPHFCAPWSTSLGQLTLRGGTLDPTMCRKEQPGPGTFLNHMPLVAFSPWCCGRG